MCVRGRQWRMAPASLPSEPLSSLLCGAVCDSSEISFSITLLVRHLRIYAKRSNVAANDRSDIGNDNLGQSGRK